MTHKLIIDAITPVPPDARGNYGQQLDSPVGTDKWREKVEGIGGEVVRATIISASAGADVSLLQLEQVTKAISARWPPNTICPSAACWPAWRRAPRSR
jgi:hypothetical protein